MPKIYVLFFKVAFYTPLCSIAFGACDQLSWKEAYFVAYNISDDEVEVLVNSKGGVFIPPNGSTSFETEIPVPRSRGNTLGPSTNEQRVKVTIAFRNLSTGMLTTPIRCTAGARVVVHIWYEVLDSGRDKTRCQSSY